MTNHNRAHSIAAWAFSPRPTKSPAMPLRHGCRHRGYTLIELLVVILIILLVSAVALPVVLPALSHRQVSEAARLLQAALAGARDAALRNGTPSGIRLLPDPAFPLTYQPMADGTTRIDPNQPLAASRIIPIEMAPRYTEGKLSIGAAFDRLSDIPYPAVNGGGYYPFSKHSTATANVLMVKETIMFGGLPNAPTSWFWNIRIGDRLQINGSGLWYTVVGPMNVTAEQGNSELFVNVGAPGTQSPLSDFESGNVAHPEFLLLVNGRDDNNDGWVDAGFDGVDNNADGIMDDLGEWEFENWPGTIVSNPPFNVPYTIERRPAPVTNAREIALPTNVVIDLTTWKNAFPERSQFPPGVVNPHTGYVDILLYPNGAVVPTTLYSSPSSFGMSAAFFHFWLAERRDVAAVTASATAPPFLPIGNIKQQLVSSSNRYPGPTLGGEYRIVTLFTRTGLVTTDDDVQFDNPMNPANGATYNPGFPFLSVRR
jgi:prepilin-type N-terminal cleavage/methylation domain-containing protein